LRHLFDIYRGGDVSLILDPAQAQNMCSIVNNDSDKDLFLLSRSAAQFDPQYGGLDLFITEVVKFFSVSFHNGPSIFNSVPLLQRWSQKISQRLVTQYSLLESSHIGGRQLRCLTQWSCYWSSNYESWGCQSKKLLCLLRMAVVSLGPFLRNGCL
jgi:hypothetical protein